MSCFPASLFPWNKISLVLYSHASERSGLWLWLWEDPETVCEVARMVAV